jgi:hypothetical protein
MPVLSSWADQLNASPSHDVDEPERLPSDGVPARRSMSGQGHGAKSVSPKGGVKTGGNNHGSRNSALAARRADSDHHPSRAHLALIIATVRADTGVQTMAIGNEASSSAVSWAAIFAGAFAALALTVVLTSLGTGLGLTTISAWPNSGASVTTFTISAGIGLIVVQWLASALGGFITGRLRTKWTGVHTHEVFFRDTAHGFLSWALAMIVGTALLAAATTSIVGGGVRAASTVARRCIGQ